MRCMWSLTKLFAMFPSSTAPPCVLANQVPSQVVRRCHSELMDSLQYRALAVGADVEERRENSNTTMNSARLQMANGLEKQGEGEEVKRARDAVAKLKESALEIEDQIRNAVTSAKTLQVCDVSAVLIRRYTLL